MVHTYRDLEGPRSYSSSQISCAHGRNTTMSCIYL